MLTDIPGIAVGHWTDTAARTGCTVVVLPPETTASGEVRGGAPATREFALLDPLRAVAHVDAVVLSGGSAFGLAAGDGVMGWLEEQDRGYQTRHGRVPIVVGMSLYDLGVGDATVRPGPAQGRAAAETASVDAVPLGQVGAGTGATAGKWLGPDGTTDAGLVGATLRSGSLVVSALVAVNAVGSIDDGTSIADPGPPARTSFDPEDGPGGATDPALGGTSPGSGADGGRTNTTIGIVATNARLDKIGCHWLAQSAHDGLARAILPAHTGGDGDAFVAAATGALDEPVDLAHLRALGQQAVAAAIRSLA